MDGLLFLAIVEGIAIVILIWDSICQDTKIEDREHEIRRLRKQLDDRA